MRRREFITLLGGAAAAGRSRRGRNTKGGLSRRSVGHPAVWPHRRRLPRRTAGPGLGRGSNNVVEYRWAEGRFDRLPAMAEELVRLKVDVIVAPAIPPPRRPSERPRRFHRLRGPGATRSAWPRGQPRRPGGNVTGFAYLDELGAKDLELLTNWSRRRPGLRCWSTRPTTNPSPASAVEAAARAIRLQNQIARCRDGARSPAPSQRWCERAGGLVGGDPFYALFGAAIGPLAAPVKHSQRCTARDRLAGGLLSYGPDLAGLLPPVGSYVDRIFKGEKPADLPVQAADQV